jgi:prepilin-type N-terminal cleavage/methylation domain-containing protein
MMQPSPNLKQTQKPTLRFNHGFTLIELTVAIIVMGILAAVGSNMISDSFLVTRYVNAENEAASASRYATERLSREIREIRHGDKTSPPEGYVISAATNQSLTFLNIKGQTISISYDPTQKLAVLTNQTLGLTGTLVREVSNFNLSYLNQNLEQAVVAADIRFIDIGLTVSPQDSPAMVASTRVALRNQP